MQEQITKLKEEFIKALETADTENLLEKVRLQFLSKKGEITKLLKGLEKLSIEEKKTYGSSINQLKFFALQEISAKKDKLYQLTLQKKLQEERIDITLPGTNRNKGHLHPITLVTNEIYEIFKKLGFEIAEGPEAETDYYNFEALNFPPDHPARDMHDTFYLKEDKSLLLRTHTSNSQIHLMEREKPPIRALIPGRVFRSDADVSHSPVFHQVEGLVVDQDISFANLKACLEFFTEAMFGNNKKIRLRPSYFPFTEPSVEVDVECVICDGKGCNVCKKTGWLEILGAGMVDPNVLKHVNVDPEKYSGFAFGMGVERIAMLKYGINNIKLFFDNHHFFVEQF